MRTDIDIGIVRGLQERREAAVERLSPAAKHQAFPRIYAKPVPMPNTNEALRKEIKDLTVKNAALAEENNTLRSTVAALQTKTNANAEIILKRLVHRKNSPRDVIKAFLAELNERRDGAEPITFDLLSSPRRARQFAAPRHVCFWLMRQLCTHYSLPMIGHLFGGRDHTTCMHGCRRAEEHWLLTNPVLKASADAVLMRFGLAETTGEGA